MKTAKRTDSRKSETEDVGPVKKVRKTGGQFKEALASPYRIQLPLVQEDDRNVILQELSNILSPLISQHKKKRKAEVKQKVGNNTSDPQQKAVSTTTDSKEKPKRRREKNVSIKYLKTLNLSFGINEVTKGLERDQLRLVIVCRDAEPTILIQHLPVMCCIKKVPLCILSNASVFLGQLFGLKSIITFGFKKQPDNQEDIFKFLVNVIISKLPPLSIPWLPSPPASTSKSEQTSTTSKSEHTPMET